MLSTSENRQASISLTEEVKQTLLGWLRDGKYPPGSRLPSVPEMVKQLDVSRTVIREALHSLVGMNLIEIRPGLGCFVNHIPSDLVLNADVVSALLGMDAIVEVVAARRIIEGAVARQVALFATEDDFEDIEDSLRQIERAVGKDGAMFSATPAFHVAIARATHNKVLEKIVSSFNLLMAAGGALIERHNPGREYRVAEYESHKKLLETLRTRDPEFAQRSMEDHVGLTLSMLTEINSNNLSVPADGHAK